MKPEFTAHLKIRDDQGDLEDWISFAGPAVMLIPILEQALEALRVYAATAHLHVPPTWPFGTCGEALAAGANSLGPCVMAAGHPPEAGGGVRHLDASARAWWTGARVS